MYNFLVNTVEYAYIVNSWPNSVTEHIMRLKLEISSNYLKAYLTILEEDDVAEQKPVSKEDITALLGEQNICFGIKDEEVEKLTGSKVEIRDVVVAEGIAPTIGKSAEVKVLKRPKRMDEIRPKANEDGDVDYISPREGWLVPVKAGEELAIKIPPTQGDPGRNIFDKEIPGIWGSDFNLDEIGGLNTEVDQENLLAKVDGFVGHHAIKITVDPVYRVYENIGPATGSIDIPLAYEVTIQTSKDVLSGFKIRANKIVVGGCIEDAEVDAKELIVEQGIVGTSDIPIKAKKIRVGYINGSRAIYCDGIVVNREISSGAKVFCAQVKANIIQGSFITASEAIWTNNMNGQNKVYIGIDYKAKMAIERCTKELNKMEEPLEQLQKVWHNAEKKMAYLKELSKKNPQHPLITKELPQIKEIKDKYDFYIKKKKELEEEREKAVKQMYPSSQPFLLVRNGFSRDTSSGSIVEPDSLINFRSEIRKIMEPRSKLFMTIIKDQVVATDNFNLKELKSRMNKIDW